MQMLLAPNYTAFSRPATAAQEQVCAARPGRLALTKDFALTARHPSTIEGHARIRAGMTLAA